MRVYKIKGFARFQRRERIADTALIEAILAAERGLVDADLGGGLIKQRIARPGQGKSGGFRTLIAYRRNERAVFLFGFAKNERANIDDDEIETMRERGQGFLDLDRVDALLPDAAEQERTFRQRPGTRPNSRGWSRVHRCEQKHSSNRIRAPGSAIFP